MATTNRNRKNILTLNGAGGITEVHLHHNHHHHHQQLAQPQHPVQDGTGANQAEGLPKPFVTAMRTLFDIMDDQKTGFVKLSDIEDRWQDDGSKGLPRGVIDSLRKVTPPNGLLSFDRFCGGLKICLLRNQTESTRTSRLSKDSEKLPLSPTKLSVRPPSAPLLDLDAITKPSWNSNSTNTATVRPNNAMPAQKTLSMPQLNPDSDLDLVLEPPPIILPGAFGPPKPPRVAQNLERSQPSSNIDKAEIRNALQNWQMSLLMSESDKTVRLTRGPADGQIDLSNTSSSPLLGMHTTGLYQKKSGGSNGRRREPRRHTLQNGVDYNMLKRLKQIEQEKDILLQGLTAVEIARDWYLKQLSIVQDKIKYLGRAGTHMETWTEAHQERLDLQRARVLEVNRHLMTLAESWERGGFPMHMNLALRPPGAMSFHHSHQRGQVQSPAASGAPGGGQSHPQPELVQRLQQQNVQLSEEVNQKNEKLSLLEREKSSLIRELLQLQRANRANSMTSNTDEMVF
ncbi:suppressor APC domain-containing protein 2 [Topomyia yanbarensis]|uniref:suppressor APC domain-containing protein 2 n=1 Tax=Topomyia yanbarensis TaxID=2498891 RepID=UPI00273AB8BD|nr:suppressor APC domain-containing protein 2 [Topomyia yanbarensis]XP_058815232.1 suppressor APC domain-containing protein 2 [Topomyia yanbarensis]XP_058815233.1 suppressor APC domain-containing protein 2 [Topomyia yanbarensis]XP_058815234.1 suppressor APC domain-containing protein 2 [Topomyia yanbarensis]XP_058815235.1 suppressor APC domain-containing protein 2 [Topomyia yanbarensis]XP_058815237.1 suppressor APC domain-containing protein 2 [Topomyia yanbarensis]XP_058815238.1 suppressor APC